MMHTSLPFARRLGVCALATAGLLALPPALAQSRAPATQAPATASPAETGEQSAAGESDRGLLLANAARDILERLEIHRERLRRVDSLLSYLELVQNREKIRLVQHLRKREIAAFQSTLREYERLLGGRDYERVLAAVRDRFLNSPASTIEEPPARRVEGREPIAQAARPAARPGPDAAQRSLARQLELERARASQRQQLSQRLQQSRQAQLRRLADQERRYATPPPPPSFRRGVPPPAARATRSDTRNERTRTTRRRP